MMNEEYVATELAKQVCHRLRDSACRRSGEITQPRTNFFGQLCIANSFVITIIIGAAQLTA